MRRRPIGTGRIELVDTQSRLAEVVDRMSRVRRVAVDIESNGFFRYHERVCLVQMASGDTAFLVDPLAMDDAQPLGNLLGDPSVEKVFHSADYDLRSLDRDWGFRVNNLFDTGIAAAFLGAQHLGLQSVVEEYAGVKLAKSRKLQRSDWTTRPLSPEAQKYAAEDVLHLIRVRDALSKRLKKLSRLPWVKEEFARLEKVRHTPPDREKAFLSIKGSRGLDGRGLAVLRSLSRFREQEASRLDRPLFKVMSDAVLVRLSSEPGADLSIVKGLGRFGRSPASRGLKAAITEGLRSRPVTRPKRRRSEGSPGPAGRVGTGTRLRSLKEWRSRLGNELQLDASLLWPTVSLERLARHPRGLDEEVASPEVRDWQKREFGSALRRFLDTFA